LHARDQRRVACRKIDAQVEWAAEAKRTADELMRHMQELAKELERLNAKRQKDHQSRRKS
jgi:hypothetical protein